MSIKLLIQPKQIFKILLFSSTALVSLSFLLCSLQYFLGNQFVILNLAKKIFSVDEEMFIPALYSSFLLIFTAFLSAIIAFVRYKKRLEVRENFWLQWITLSIIFIFLAWDEAVSLHEKLIGNPTYEGILQNSGLTSIDTIGILQFSWVILGIIVVVGFILSYAKLFINLPSKYQKCFGLAFSSYIGGALGMEVIGGIIKKSFTQESIAYILSTSIEELFEMIGISLLIYAMLRYLSFESRNIDITFQRRNLESSPDILTEDSPY